MKFLCDVHISSKLVKFLIGLGFDTIHVNNILDGWHTRDEDSSLYADSNDLNVISKDPDFRDSYFVRKTLRKLIEISLGNISNSDLQVIFEKNIQFVEKLNTNKRFFIEIDKENITFVKD